MRVWLGGKDMAFPCLPKLRWLAGGKAECILQAFRKALCPQAGRRWSTQAFQNAWRREGGGCVFQAFQTAFCLPAGRRRSAFSRPSKALSAWWEGCGMRFPVIPSESLGRKEGNSSRTRDVLKSKFAVSLAVACHPGSRREGQLVVALVLVLLVVVAVRRTA